MQARLVGSLLPAPSPMSRILWWRLRPARCEDSLRRGFCRMWKRPPTLYDSAAWAGMDETIRQWLLYHGYRRAAVLHWTRFQDRRAVVAIHIQPGPRDTIAAFRITVEDSFLRPLVETYFAQHPVIGQPLDADSLDRWRYSLAQFLTRHQIWNFSPQNVNWLIDTTGSALSLTANITGGPFFQRHIDSVLLAVKPRFPVAAFDTLRHHTLRVVHPPRLIHGPTLKYVYPTPLPSRWSLYHLQLMEQRLNNYTAFQAVRSRFIPIKIDSSTREGHFSASMTAFMAPRYRLEGQIGLHTTEESSPLGTQQGRFYGVSFSTQWIDRNFLRRLIQWNTKLQVSFESTLQARTQVISNTNLQLSTGLLFARALFLDELTHRVQAQEEQTLMEVSHIQDLNVSYQRIAFSGQFLYRFVNKHNRHTFTPLFVNYSRIHILDSVLQKTIEQSADPFLQEVFRPHVIPLFRYAFFYTDLSRTPRPPWNVVLYWTPIESAGNLAYLISRWTRRDSPPYTIGKVPFYQYFKTNLDFRLHHFFTSASVHFRFWGGIAYPYGNVGYLPFEVRYYIGGANSLRGWRYQEVGPGGWDAPDASPFERSGEMLLLASYEFRWTITGPWKGAIFADAGNVWNVSRTYGHPDSRFRWPSFIHQVAVGGGFGLRRDFEYFILRGDLAVPLHDPIQQSWLFSQWSPRWLADNLHFHIGVGYPF